jgi:DnaD/phage-associated family protein
LRAENQEETADGSIGGGKTDSRKLPVNTHASGALDDLRDNEEFGQLVFNLEQYAGIATPQQIGVLEYFYGDLKMSFDLLDYLIEFCAQGGKLTNRYMESVGVNWYEQGIRTPEDAKALVQSFSDPRTKKPKKSGGVSQGRPNKFLNVGKTSMDYEKLAEQEEMDKVLHGFD